MPLLQCCSIKQLRACLPRCHRESASFDTKSTRPPYTAAKAGLRYLTHSLAKELAADHVKVNAIALGVFPQDSGIMREYSEEALDVIRQGIPAGRFGAASDIVGLIQFLASRSSSYITGATIPLDGGMHI
jgi:NAD(P)-dependent dehydrogenase (short-subunit alcohol dehydrogenase family)